MWFEAFVKVGATKFSLRLNRTESSVIEELIAPRLRCDPLGSHRRVERL